jgi:chromosome segregation ATPase
METTEGVVSIQEAANRLGITEDGVKKRIKRGRLKAQRINDALYVFVSEVERQAADKQQDTRLSQKVSQQRRQDKQNKLVSALEEDVAYLKQQITIKDQQLAEKDQQLKELLSDNAAWREQVRYKELQMAQLQDWMIPLPSAEEPEPTEQASEVREPAVAQAAGSGNALSRIWHWFIGQ